MHKGEGIRHEHHPTIRPRTAAPLVGALAERGALCLQPPGKHRKQPDEYAVFEAVHGSAPKYKGQNKVNPMAMMFSGMLMLRHLDEGEAADRLERALAAVIAEGRSVTYDMKPTRDDPTAVGTSQVADAVIAKMQEGA